MFPSDTRILLAEDTDVTRAIIMKMIAKLGYTNITQVADGAAAKQEIDKACDSKRPFQLIISDWNMPELSGLALLKKMRGDSVMHTVPFLILTSNNEKEQVMEAIRAGVSSYLAKPFTVETLEKKIAECFAATQRKKAS